MKLSNIMGYAKIDPSNITKIKTIGFNGGIELYG